MNNQFHFTVAAKVGDQVELFASELLEHWDMELGEQADFQIETIMPSFEPLISNDVLMKLNLEQLKEVAEEIGGLTAEEIFNKLEEEDKEEFSCNDWKTKSEFFKDLDEFELPAIEIAQKIAFGAFDYSHKYVKFDGAENFESSTYIPYEDEFIEIVEKWIEKRFNI